MLSAADVTRSRNPPQSNIVPQREHCRYPSANLGIAEQVSVLSFVLAAIAATCNAVSSSLQRKANKEEPAELSFGPRLLLDLLQRPIWLGGGLLLVASFILQATALDFGTLSGVEPVLVAELPLTLVFGAWLLHRPLRLRDGLMALSMAAGLALFLGAIGPSGGDPAAADAVTLAVATGGTVAAVVAFVLAGEFGPTRLRPALLGCAAGTGFGLAASLMKLAVSQMSSGGILAALESWEVYGMVAAGVAALVLVQAALRTGTLVAAQPGITLLDPLVSIVWGTAVLNEQTQTGPILVLAGLGAALMILGVLTLVRSPTLAEAMA